MEKENEQSNNVASENESENKGRKWHPPFRLRYMSLIAIAAGVATVASVYLDLIGSLVVLAVFLLLILIYNILYKVHWDAMAIFATLGEYKYSNIYYDNCVSYIEEEKLAAEKEEKYIKAVNLFESGNYADAMVIFATLYDYKDSTGYYYDCLSCIEAEKLAAEKEAKYLNAISLMESQKYAEALEIFTKLGDYNQSTTKITEIINICENIASNLASEGDYSGACAILQEINYDQNSDIYKAYNHAVNGDFANAVLCGLSVVVFPEGTESIPDNYFKDKNYANKLQKVILPASVKTIGSFAFAGCGNLTKIQWSENLVSIGESAFDRCLGLKNIELPEGLIEIGKGAFASSGISEITFPTTLQFIYDEAFADCDYITSITLPEGLVTLGESAFWNCEALLSVTIGKGLETINEDAFRDCFALTSISIPEGVKKIGANAFRSCKNLASITLPQSLERIDDNAFYECKKLEEITITANVNWIGANVFAGCTSLKKVYFENTEDWTDGVSKLKLQDESENASRLVYSSGFRWYKKQAQ